MCRSCLLSISLRAEEAQPYVQTWDSRCFDSTSKCAPLTCPPQRAIHIAYICSLVHAKSRLNDVLHCFFTPL
jgi:hypothetical protein